MHLSLECILLNKSDDLVRIEDCSVSEQVDMAWNSGIVLGVEDIFQGLEDLSASHIGIHVINFIFALLEILFIVGLSAIAEHSLEYAPEAIDVEFTAIRE